MVKINDFNINGCIHQLLIFFIFLFILFSSYGNAFEKSEDNFSPYDQLYNLRNKKLLDTYDEFELKSNNYYKRALNESDNFPMHSYELLLDCQSKLYFRNISNKNKSSIYDEISRLNDRIYGLEKNLSKHRFLTISSCEWHSLSSKYIEIAKKYIVDSGYYYGDEKINESLNYLLYSKFYYTKSIDFFTISIIRNNQNSTLNHSKINSVLKNISEKWIHLSESTINYVSSFGKNNDIINSYQVLNNSKRYFNSTQYYLSLMDASSAKAIANYLDEKVELNTREKGLEITKSYIEYANLSLSRINSDSTIDAPLAKLNFEISALHLNDSYFLTDATASTAVMSMSIKESFIASQQAQAAIAIKSELLGSNISNNESSSVSKSENDFLIYGYLIIAGILGITLISLYVRKKYFN